MSAVIVTTASSPGIPAGKIAKQVREELGLSLYSLYGVDVRQIVNLWTSGRDTLDIARERELPEPVVCAVLSVWRAKRRAAK